MAYSDILYEDDPFMSALQQRLANLREQRSPISPQGGRDFLNQLLSKLVADESATSFNNYIPENSEDVAGGAGAGGARRGSYTVPRVTTGFSSGGGTHSVRPPTNSHSNRDPLGESIDPNPIAGTGPGTYSTSTPSGTSYSQMLDINRTLPTTTKKKRRNRGASSPSVTRR